MQPYDHTVMILFQKTNWCDNMVAEFWEEILIALLAVFGFKSDNLVRQYGRTNFKSCFLACFSFKRRINATILWSHNNVFVSINELARQYGPTVLGRDLGRTLLCLFETWKWCDNMVATNFMISLFCRLSFKGVIGVLSLFHKTNWCDNMVAQFWEEILVAPCCFCIQRGIGARLWSHQFQISLFCCFIFKHGIGATIWSLSTNLVSKYNWCDNMV